MTVERKNDNLQNPKSSMYVYIIPMTTISKWGG